MHNARILLLLGINNLLYLGKWRRFCRYCYSWCTSALKDINGCK